MSATSWQRLRGWRPRLRAETLALAASLFFALACNGAWWRAAMQGRDPALPATWLWAGALFVALVAAHFVLFSPLLNRWTAKPVLALLIVATAFSVYYMQRYGIYLDPSMIRNVLRTDVKEARELFGLGMLPHLLLYAGVPLLLLWRVRVERRRLLRSTLGRVGTWLIGLALGVAAIVLVFQEFASLMRNQRELRYLITPSNVVYSLLRVGTEDTQAAARPKRKVGEDVQRGPGWAARTRPVLFVFVVGETARAANWGLNGYARQTTPQLAALPELISFAQVDSCGTNTEVSLPCMFSPGGRRRYDEAAIRGSETLLQVLARAGLKVTWRDNQSGCKGVCDGVEVQLMADARVPRLCDAGRCLDEVLLHDLDRVVDAAPGGSRVLVLHQLGNHGPAYFLRYPPAFRKFEPTCDTPELNRCSREQIVNAYDNALLYTDHVLARTIEFLKRRERTHDVALLYVSDHGESLGENNIYLHGLPYAIAPEAQTRVPMFMWFSAGYAKSFGLDLGCLRQRAAQPASHDHLFHTMIGLLDLKTKELEPAMDLSAGCRR